MVRSTWKKVGLVIALCVASAAGSAFVANSAQAAKSKLPFTITYRYATSPNIPTNTEGAGTSWCEPGEIVTGGGGYTASGNLGGGAGTVGLTVSRPDYNRKATENIEGWDAGMFNTNSNTQVVVVSAMCAAP